MNRKRIFTILGSILTVVIVGAGIAGVVMAKDLKAYKQRIADTVITDVDLSKVPDGLFQGSYDMNWVAAEVEISVKDHRITDIHLLSHKNGRGKPAEVLLETVINEQSLSVDIVSGATASSKAILKSIELALEQDPVIK